MPKAIKTGQLSELDPHELYRRGADVVRGSEVKVGDTIVIDGWAILMTVERGMGERQAIQYQELIGQLTGARIDFAGVADDNDYGYIAFIQVTLKDGRKLTLEGVEKIIGLPKPKPTTNRKDNQNDNENPS